MHKPMLAVSKKHLSRFVVANPLNRIDWDKVGSGNKVNGILCSIDPKMCHLFQVVMQQSHHVGNLQAP
eukprot:2393550-Karenia_brevis.AAC.2